MKFFKGYKPIKDNSIARYYLHPDETPKLLGNTCLGNSWLYAWELNIQISSGMLVPIKIGENRAIVEVLPTL
ncbi:MAG: hypothetical protein ACRCR2_02580 [Fusobacteriaceae bacterium]